jgi:hypothetical protein
MTEQRRIRLVQLSSRAKHFRHARGLAGPVEREVIEALRRSPLAAERRVEAIGARKMAQLLDGADTSLHHDARIELDRLLEIFS